MQQVQENTNVTMQEMVSKLTELEAEAYSLKYLSKFEQLKLKFDSLCASNDFVTFYFMLINARLYPRF